MKEACPMISDVLSDAGYEIERYLEHYPEVYADCLDEVHAVLAAMGALRRKLDNPHGHWDWQAQQLDTMEENL
jgi:hypothetical protein